MERAHQTIGKGIKCMLIGAGLPIKFWPYTFHHIIKIRNAIPGQGQTASPLKLATGIKEDISTLKTWGCRVWVRPPGIQPRRFTDEARKGIFLGCLPNFFKNIIWFDLETERVKIARHCLYDEGFNDLPTGSEPPNAQYLIRVNNGERPKKDRTSIDSNDLQFYVCPYADCETVKVKIPKSNTSTTFGFSLAADELYNRVYVKGMSGVADNIFKGKNKKRRLCGAYYSY